MLAKDLERTGMRRCRLCWVQEDENSALELEEQSRNNPDDAYLHYRLAAKYIVLCRYDRAHEAVTRAIDLGMNDDVGYGMLGRVCVESGRMEEAKEASVKAFKINSNNPMSSVNLAIYYSLKGDFETAMDYFDIAARLAPESHRLFGERGLHYARVGMIHEALADLKKAIELHPCNQDYYLNMSEIYLKNGQRDEARKVLEMSIDNRPGCAESYHSLAKIYADCGMGDAALENIDKALQLDPSNSDFISCRNHILRAADPFS